MSGGRFVMAFEDEKPIERPARAWRTKWQFKHGDGVLYGWTDHPSKEIADERARESAFNRDFEYRGAFPAEPWMDVWPSDEEG